MNSRICEACSKSPSGIEGHAALVRGDLQAGANPQALPPIVFRCVHCSSMWSRSYVGDGVFLWYPFEQSERLVQT